jgi:hypothetical protein
MSTLPFTRMGCIAEALSLNLLADLLWFIMCVEITLVNVLTQSQECNGRK